MCTNGLLSNTDAVFAPYSHGIQTPALVLDAMQRNLRWFNKWLAAD